MKNYRVFLQSIHNFKLNTETIAMIYAAIAAVINFFAMLALLPVAFGVNCRFSLDRELGMIHVTKFGFNVISIKIAAVDGKTRVEINGKQIKNGDNTKNKNVPLAVRFIANEKLVGAVYALGLVGGNDAAGCAVKIAAINIAYNFIEKFTRGARSPRSAKETVTPDKCLLVADFEENRLDLEVRTALNISLMQAVRLIYLLNSK